MLAIGGPAISIAAGSLKVALRNLVIGPLAGGGGTLGIFMTAGTTTANVSDSVISGGLVGVHTYAAIAGSNASLSLTPAALQ